MEIRELIDELFSLENRWKAILNSRKQPSETLIIKTINSMVNSSRILKSIYSQDAVPKDLPDKVVRLKKKV